jgi:hypothetical protein
VEVLHYQEISERLAIGLGRNTIKVISINPNTLFVEHNSYS